MSTTRTIKIKSGISGPTKNLQKGHFNTQANRRTVTHQTTPTTRKDN